MIHHLLPGSSIVASLCLCECCFCQHEHTKDILILPISAVLDLHIGPTHHGSVYCRTCCKNPCAWNLEGKT